MMDFSSLAVEPGSGLGTELLPVSRVPLPRLTDPEPRPVEVPVAEPLVDLDHSRIAILEAYARAGFTTAPAGARLRSGVVDRLELALDALPYDFGFAVFDAWRPTELQSELYRLAYSDSNLPPGFVAPPSTDPALPAPHLTGGAVDLTLTFKGMPLALGTHFDDFTPRAHTDHFEDVDSPIRGLRRTLYWTMRSAGFVVLHCEWWHFEFGTCRWGAVTGGDPIYGPAL